MAVEATKILQIRFPVSEDACGMAYDDAHFLAGWNAITTSSSMGPITPRRLKP
jgi:hypothetical protein